MRTKFDLKALKERDRSEDLDEGRRIILQDWKGVFGVHRHSTGILHATSLRPLL